MEGFYWVVVNWESRKIYGGCKEKEYVVNVKECLENLFPLSEYDLVRMYVCGD